MTVPTPPRRRSADLIVSAGILLSRVAGLLRESLLGHYLGTSPAAGAFKAAIRIPNLLQNLFGEGVLSASFIPVYTRLRAEGRHRDAARVASAVGSLLFLTVAVLSALGVTLAPHMVAILAGGFTPDVQLLTVRLVQIMFPGVGLLVLSAWCLGVLNSHRKFFLSYAAPVAWNAVQIGVLWWGGRRLGVVGASHEMRDVEQARLAVWLAWATVGGALLQLAVQLPPALLLCRGVRPTLGRGMPEVRTVLANFGPALIGRGAAQLSAYVDLYLVGFLGTAATAAMAYAQQLYLLPISLFGMAVSASELPEMSSAVGGAEAVKAQLSGRLTAAFPRLAFFVIPSLVAFLLLGDVLVATLFQSGVFHRQDTLLVWVILCGSTVGLLAATQGRLLSSAFYALHDTQTPLRFALVRLALTAGWGWAIVLPLRAHFGWSTQWAAAGLTASAGVAGWVEFALLRWALQKRIGHISLGGPRVWRAWLAAVLAGAVGYAAHRAQLHYLPGLRPILYGPAILGIYGSVYFILSAIMDQPEAKRILGRFVK